MAVVRSSRRGRRPPTSHKPAQYAAQHPAYLRVEIDSDVTITVYELDDGATVYAEVGTFGQGEVAPVRARRRSTSRSTRSRLSGRRSEVVRGMSGINCGCKAEEESVAELLPTTTTQSGAS